MPPRSTVGIRALNILTEYDSWTIKQKDLFEEIRQTMQHELRRGTGKHTYAKLSYAYPCQQCSAGGVQLFMRAENNWHTPLIDKFGDTFPDWQNRSELIGIALCGECAEPYLLIAD